MANSVLETFYILFKTDAGDVEKGTKKAKKSVDHLQKGISGADKQAGELGKSFNALTGKAVAAFAAIFSVNKIMGGMGNAARAATGLQVTAAVLGESTADVVAYSRAFALAGGTVEGFLGSMKGLNASLVDAFMHGANATTDILRRMGIDSLDEFKKMKSAFMILDEFMDHAERKNLNREAVLSSGRSIGLDDATIIAAWQRRKAGMHKLIDAQRNLNGLTDDQRDDLRELDAAIKAVGFTIDDFFGRLGSDAVIGFKAATNYLDSMNEGLALAQERWSVVKAITDVATGDAMGRVLDLWSPAGMRARKTELPENYDEMRRQKDLEIFDRWNDNIMDLFNDPAGLFKRMFMDTTLPLPGAPVPTSGPITVTIDNVNVETQATDVQGISSEISSVLKNELEYAISSIDNGVLA